MQNNAEMPDSIKPYFKPPFVCVENYVYDNDDNMCLSVFKHGYPFMAQVCKVLNGGKSIELDGVRFSPSTSEHGLVNHGDRAAFWIRGWERLHYLDNGDKIQDEFADWVIKVLNRNSGRIWGGV